MVTYIPFDKKREDDRVRVQFYRYLINIYFTLDLCKAQNTQLKDTDYDSCSHEILSLVGEGENKCLNITQCGNAITGHATET